MSLSLLLSGFLYVHPPLFLSNTACSLEWYRGNNYHPAYRLSLNGYDPIDTDHDDYPSSAFTRSMLSSAFVVDRKSGPGDDLDPVSTRVTSFNLKGIQERDYVRGERICRLSAGQLFSTANIQLARLRNKASASRVMDLPCHVTLTFIPLLQIMLLFLSHPA